MGNNYCSTCKTKAQSASLVQYECNHHTCIKCIQKKIQPILTSPYKLLACDNCHQKSLFTDDYKIKIINLEEQFTNIPKIRESILYKDNSNIRDYIIWVLAKKQRQMLANLSSLQASASEHLRLYQEHFRQYEKAKQQVFVAKQQCQQFEKLKAEYLLI